MTQRELDCAVANATGESLSVIECMGFSIEPPHHFDDDEPVLAVTCPFCGGVAILANTPEDLPIDAECGRCDTLFPYDNDEVYSISLDEIVVPAERIYAPAA